jgi:putative methyltransferase (TIGR04325 family)
MFAVGKCLRYLLGYRSTFASLGEARACALRFSPFSHEHPRAIERHAGLADVIRESDYPALFYLAPIASRLKNVLDLGGNVGNLFYAYRDHLEFPDDLNWMVHDLPAIHLAGRKFAKDRNETRIHFVDDLSTAASADALLIFGALHYFESLPAIVKSLSALPKHILVNRSPCSDGEDIITVQDVGSYLVACKLHGFKTLFAEMEALGYVLRAKWPVYERKFRVPLYPESSSRTYSGFYLERVN